MNKILLQRLEQLLAKAKREKLSNVNKYALMQLLKGKVPPATLSVIK